MNFGHFDDENMEYVITTPKTPLPWINYLGSNDFFTLISNTSGGYSFYKDAKLLRLTRYRYNDVPLDSNGKYFYIKDGSTVWNPAWQPVKTPLDEYECRHGMGYTKFHGKKDDVSADVLCFVPMDDTCEVQRIEIKNESKEEKKLQLFSYVEFCLWNAMDDMTNYQRNLSTGEVEVIGSTIYHKTEYRERRNHYAVYSVNTKADGFDTSREDFMGVYNSAANPDAVLEGKCRNSVASGWYPIASHQIDVTLAPGESKSFVFVLGYCENPDDDKWEAQDVINKKPAEKMLSRYQTDADVEKSFNSLKDYWKKLLSKFTVDTSNDKVNRMVNIWNQYQCMVTFNMSRSASYYESGIGRGMGFRDSCQDLLGFVHLIPDRARQRIIDIASTQFEDGSAYHQYQPLTKKGNSDIGSGFNDDPLWLIAGTSAYIRETGDTSILDEKVPYDNDMSKATSLFEHLTRSLDYIINHKGPHKLPLIGRADWNDCLNLNCYSDTPDESFQTFSNPNAPDERVAESVLIAGMFVSIGPELVAIERRKGCGEKAQAYQQEIDAMVRTIEKDGWDGEWFIRAYDAMGHKVGSRECEDGKIFIESQGYCVMAGIGLENGMAEKALESVHQHLETEHGIVLLQPAYKEYHLELGEVSSYPGGYKENAGIFCHNNPWIIAAETVVGHGDRAFDLYSRIAPAWREEISELHKMEPYVYSQMIAGRDAANFGQAKNSWLTGTAAWNFYVISNYILGIKPDWDGLKVDPCIPHTWDSYQVSRRFRNAVYSITIRNPKHVCRGVSRIIADGKELEGSVLPVYADGKCHSIEVELG